MRNGGFDQFTIFFKDNSFLLLAESLGLNYILKYDPQIPGWNFLTLS